jgi:hypothetical protein
MKSTYKVTYRGDEGIFKERYNNFVRADANGLQYHFTSLFSHIYPELDRNFALWYRSMFSRYYNYTGVTYDAIRSAIEYSIEMGDHGDIVLDHSANVSYVITENQAYRICSALIRSARTLLRGNIITVETWQIITEILHSSTRCYQCRIKIVYLSHIRMFRIVIAYCDGHYLQKNRQYLMAIA